MKIGIVTCHNMKNVNYGNRLQAYALNKYLRNRMPEAVVETLQVSGFKSIIRTKDKYFLFSLLKKILKKLLQKGKDKNLLDTTLKKRLERFNDFSKKNIVLSDSLNYDGLINSHYDILITGSDVVWYQKPYIYKPLMFLDYEFAFPVKRIAYAASLGRDYIPESNRKYIKKALDRFEAVSVREKSSIRLLSDIGINKVSHCIDPTLLLDPVEWETLEKDPEMMDREGNGPGYIFVYLLGNRKEDRDNIQRIAKNMNLQIVNVPFAKGVNRDDEHFGDVQATDCNPEEWLWYIHHSRYVITDSFHGVAFSIIFETPFIVVERAGSGINNRLYDFLNNIGQEDKLKDISTMEEFTDIVWDYPEIKENISRMKKNSEQFLKNALEAQ